MEQLVYTPTDFVAIANQSLAYTFGIAYIEGELANFRISKNKWVYFDIKDDMAKVSCFATIYALPGPLEDGMLVKVAGSPRLHPQFGFSVTVQSIQPSGEGSIKKAFDLLKVKLESEDLFDESRKRALPYPPKNIALVTSSESAAYADFTKIIGARWPFVKITVYDTQVQGEAAPAQLAAAIVAANNEGTPADILVVTRGGGSADDLAAFNDERVVRAIAASRIPTLVAIGHEVDESLAELAADMRASTPSNAAELAVPDKQSELYHIKQLHTRFAQMVRNEINAERSSVQQHKLLFAQSIHRLLQRQQDGLVSIKQILSAYNPDNVLQRGYALVASSGKVVRSATDVTAGQSIQITTAAAMIKATVTDVQERN